MLDLLGEREPFYESAARIVTKADKGSIEIVVSALSYPTIFYLLSRFEKGDIVFEKIRKFKVLVKTSDLSDKIINKALSSGFTDFEDALQYFCAVRKDCSLLITRNVKDFKLSSIPVLTPDEYLKSQS